MKYERNCKLCGKKFETNYPSKEYCSYRCRYAAGKADCLVEKKCKICGKVFMASPKKSYCSDKCRAIGVQDSPQYKRQLCWTCQKATGYCSWSSILKPVKGWDAKMVKRKDGGFTYRIKSCPEYLADDYTKRGGVKK